MTLDDIRIEHIKTKDLLDFAKRAIDGADEGQFVPITMQRAIAHANDPNRIDDDVSLLVAMDAADEIVGYFGTMPQILRHNDQYSRAYYFTTWTVSAKVRGRGVGSQLMKEALTLGRDYLIFGNIHSRRVARKYNFWDGDSLIYYWADMTGMLRLNPVTWVFRLIRKIFHLLRVEKPVEISNGLTKLVDRILSPISKRILLGIIRIQQSSILDEIQYEKVDRITVDIPRAPDRPEVEIHRSVDTINWMLEYPWVLKKGESPTEKMDFFFSDTRPLFEYVPFEVFSPQTGEPLGFVVFSVSQKGEKIFMKTLDYQFSDSAHKKYVFALAMEVAKQYRVDTIEFPSEIVAYLNRLLRRIMLFQRERTYQCMPKSEDSPLAKAWSKLTPHLYDGDFSFT